MFTSVTDPARASLLRHAAGSFCGALFLAVFGAIYEHFSFGVYSNYMLYAFLPPLIAGLLLLFSVSGTHLPQQRTLFLLHACVAACSVGCITAGILRISGRTSDLLLCYPAAGALLAMFALLSYLKDRKSAS